MIGGTAISTQALLNSSHSHKLGHELEMLFKNRMYVVVLKQKNNMNYDLKAEAGSALLKAEAGIGATYPVFYVTVHIIHTANKKFEDATEIIGFLFFQS